MNTSDALEIIQRERTRALRLRGENLPSSPEQVVAAVAKQLGEAAQAAAARNMTWFAEELSQICVAALLALERLPEISVGSLETEGIAIIDRIETPYPRIVAKTTEPPPDAVQVSSGAQRVYVGKGAVWISEKP
jgi:hypothetical protein